MTDDNKNENIENSKSVNSKVLTSVAVIAVAIIIIIIAFLALVKSGALLATNGKILKAIENTLEPGHLMSDLDASSILDTNKYTISFDAYIEGIAINGKYQNSDKEKALSGGINYIGSDMSFDSRLDKKELKVDIPMLESLFVYNYKDDNSAYIEEFLHDMELEKIDSILEGIYDSEYLEITDKMKKTVEKEFLNLDFKKIDKEEFHVNGKERSCPGYATTITGKEFSNIIDSWNDISEDYFDLKLIDDTYIMDDMDEVNLTFYIYKNQLAAVIFETPEGDEVIIKFRGGDYPMQNLVLESKYYGEIFTSIEIEGRKVGSIETIEISEDSERALKIEYNTKSGEFEIEKNDYGYKTITEGNISSSKKEIIIKIDRISYDDEVSNLNATISFKKGTDIKDIKSRSEELYINEMDERDIESLMEDMGLSGYDDEYDYDPDYDYDSDYYYDDDYNFDYDFE